MDVEADGAQADHLQGDGADGSACVLVCQRISSLMRNRGGTSPQDTDTRRGYDAARLAARPRPDGRKHSAARQGSPRSELVRSADCSLRHKPLRPLSRYRRPAFRCGPR